MTILLRRFMVVVVIVGFVFAPLVSSGTPVVFSASGADATSILPTVDSFRSVLGGVNNGNAPGPLATGFREINWDGGGTATTLSATPFAGFRDNRGALFTTGGTGFVQATPAGLGTTFNNNPTYGTLFQTFSSPRLFSPIGSNVTDVQFFVPGPGTNTAATTSAFGAVFANVRLANTTSIEFFNKIGASLGKFGALSHLPDFRS